MQWSVKPSLERAPKVRILLPALRRPDGSVVEHVLGKDEAAGSIPALGSKNSWVRILPKAKLSFPSPAQNEKFTNPTSPATIKLKPKIVKKRSGFMLVDLLLTLLFATTLIMLLLVTATTLTQTFRSNLQSIATRIATKKIEDLRKTSYASLPPNGSFLDPDLVKLPSSSANLTMVNYLSSVDIKQATITVNWIQNEAPKQIILNTLIYKNGI